MFSSGFLRNNILVFKKIKGGVSIVFVLFLLSVLLLSLVFRKSVEIKLTFWLQIKMKKSD